MKFVILLSINSLLVPLIIPISYTQLLVVKLSNPVFFCSDAPRNYKNKNK